MNTIEKEINERVGLTSSNKLELMLFRLGKYGGASRSQIYGINVFKLRELMAMPNITAIANVSPFLLGVVNIRGQIIPVIDLPAVLGCQPENGLKILMVTEFGRTTQAFAVEDVDEIVRLNWSQVRAADGAAAGNGTVTSIAQLDHAVHGTQLAQILDVEQILQDVFPPKTEDVLLADVAFDSMVSKEIRLLVADDSSSARKIIAQGLQAMRLTYTMTKTGKEAWEALEDMHGDALATGGSLADKVTMVLTDLEMPEMDGFMLTRMIRADARFTSLPVVIHSSLTGQTNEQHVKSAGADGYVAKFKVEDLAKTIRSVLQNHPA